MPDAFVPGSAPYAVPLFSGAPLLDAEKRDCYRVAVEFQQLAGELLPRRGHANRRDQLARPNARRFWICWPCTASSNLA